MTKQRYRVAAHADGRVESIRKLSMGGASFGSGFEGAQRNRRLASFRPSDTGINSLVIQSGATLRARARYLVRNNPYARRAQRVFVTYLVGTGLRPLWMTQDDKAKSAITNLWDVWTDEADADGVSDFYGMQVVAARALFDSGECFIRRRPRRASDGLSVPMQLQLLESDMCPFELNMQAPGNPNNVIRAGVEFNPIGQRVAYWFWRQHPGEYAVNAVAGGFTRVPAEDVLHLFEVLRPGQVRGLPWVTSSIVRAWLLDQYDDAELERKKTAANITGFIVKPENSPDDPPMGAEVSATTDDGVSYSSSQDEATLDLSPGTFHTLELGEDVRFAEAADVGPNYEAFEYRALLAMCAGWDTPYSTTTGDFKGTNYSNEKARQLDMRAAIKPIQRNVVMFQLCRPVSKWFVEDGVLSGALPIRTATFNANQRDYTRTKWIPPHMDWLDPVKDIQADVAAIRAGLKSREEVALARGMTLDELDAAIARSNASADKYELILDSDPRRVAKGTTTPPPGGQSPSTTPAAPDGSDEDNTVDEAGDEVAA